MGGELYPSGDPERAPTQISAPHQAYFNGSIQAAQATIAALYHSEMTGEGQHVDVSIQHAVTHVAMKGIEDWYSARTIVRRVGAFFSRPRPAPLGPLNLRLIWPCKDGYVCFRMAGGVDVASRKSAENMINLLDRAGMAGFLKDYDWGKYDWQTIPQEEQERLEKPFLNYFATKTKNELYNEALKERVILAPVGTVKDLVDSPQLEAREYWEQVYHPELKDTITYPGAFAKISETPIKFWRRAPLIGEHNEEVYEKELGLSNEEVERLKNESVI
jgi:crotonobetainyl-CoA:carnitine CoA-transferase CaiB-like acyl-CoA transferase